MEIERKTEKVKKVVEVEEEKSFIHLKLTREEFGALALVAGHLWADEHDGAFGIHGVKKSTKEQAAVIRGLSCEIYEKRFL